MNFSDNWRKFEMVEKYLRDKCILIVDDEQEILNMVVSIWQMEVMKIQGLLEM